MKTQPGTTKDGKVDYPVPASNEYGTWYVKGGKIDFKYNGAKGYTIKNSKVTTAQERHCHEDDRRQSNGSASSSTTATTTKAG